MEAQEVFFGFFFQMCFCENFISFEKFIFILGKGVMLGSESIGFRDSAEVQTITAR